MTTRTSATRYARALLDVLLKESTAERGVQDLSEVEALLQQFPELRRAFTNPSIPAGRKRALVAELLPKLSLSAPVGKLLLLLAERDRLVLLPDLIAVYQERVEAMQNIVRAEVTTAAATARSAREDAVAARQQAAVKIAAGALPPPLPDMADLSGRLADLGALLADGRWTRLASELDLLEREVATATAAYKGAERAVVAAMAKRDELRGLLGAYKAKAARLGGAEDSSLAQHYDRARDLLWTAPCDLAAAEAAVAAYQQAVLGVQP